MKILHIQTGMSPAGNAAYRLHLAMLRNGIASKVLIYTPTLQKKGVYSIKQTPTLLLKKLLNNKKSQYIKKHIKEDAYFFSTHPLLDVGIDKNPLVREADVVYLHWIAGNFLSLNDIDKLAKSKRLVVFFMHDMFTFTGGCHHSFSCEQYKENCRACPIIKNKKRIALNENSKKLKLYKKYDNLIFISPSEWMAKCARRSTVLENKPVYVIPNVVNESIFKPLDKEFARTALGIPKDKYIITFGCQSGTKNKYKGWEYLRDAINGLNGDNIHCVIYGSDYNQATVDELKYPVQFLGPIYDEIVLSLICNASDLFVSPSLAESFGLTYLENIMCSTPVIGFNCTAVPEIIKHCKNGYLAEYMNIESLRKGIEHFYINNKTIQKDKLHSSSEIIAMHIKLLSSFKDETF